MALERKLKPDHNLTGALIPLSMFPITGLALLAFGLQIGLYILAVLMWVFSLYYLYASLRTENLAQWVLFAEGLIFGFMFLVFTPKFGLYPIDFEQFKAGYISIVVFFGFLIISLALTRRLKWRGREIFELAGRQVDETGNGYTSRPRPVGKVEYSPQQIRAFSRFCARHLVALPFINAKNITLVPVKMGDEYGRLLGLSGDYLDATWVNFDSHGEVSVHISQKDYLDYREPLAFDALCISLGQVFIDFLELFTRGEAERAIYRLDELRLPVLS